MTLRAELREARSMLRPIGSKPGPVRMWFVRKLCDRLGCWYPVSPTCYWCDRLDPRARSRNGRQLP